MLLTLVNNVSIEKILLFLFVNKEAYGSELRHSLKIPLSPVQKGLQKLEDGGILKSYFKKNKKVFSFNSEYLLFEELQNLLKKAYLHLPTSLKQMYCQLHRPTGKYQDKVEKTDFRTHELNRFYKRLQKVKTLKIEASFQEKEQMNVKKGEAEVDVDKTGSNQLIFNEKGHWLLPQLSELIFKNTFRWSYNEIAQVISIEHLRYGEDKPVFLFDLTTDQTSYLESINTYSQLDEIHMASIHWTKKQIHFQWRIIGHHKNDFIHYYYT